MSKCDDYTLEQCATSFTFVCIKCLKIVFTGTIANDCQLKLN